jgi:hypothetical protein
MSTLQATCDTCSTQRPVLRPAGLLKSLWTTLLSRVAAPAVAAQPGADADERVYAGLEGLSGHTLRDIGAPDWALERARRHEQAVVMRAYDHAAW